MLSTFDVYKACFYFPTSIVLYNFIYVYILYLQRGFTDFCNTDTLQNSLPLGDLWSFVLYQSHHSFLWRSMYRLANQQISPRCFTAVCALTLIIQINLAVYWNSPFLWTFYFWLLLHYCFSPVPAIPPALLPYPSTTRTWPSTPTTKTSETMRTPACSLSPASSISLSPLCSLRESPSGSLVTRTVSSSEWNVLQHIHESRGGT